MLTLIFILSIILGIICASIYDGFGSDTAEMLGYLSVIIMLISGFVLMMMLFFFPYNVEAKIEMYEQENIAIEQKVKETVRAYMEYEQETYDNLVKDADLMTVVIKYPELNSNELVKAEIEIYTENSKKIKELKEGKINKKTMSWWLYFGGRR